MNLRLFAGSDSLGKDSQEYILTGSAIPACGLFRLGTLKEKVQLNVLDGNEQPAKIVLEEGTTYESRNRDSPPPIVAFAIKKK